MRHICKVAIQAIQFKINIQNENFFKTIPPNFITFSQRGKCCSTSTDRLANTKN